MTRCFAANITHQPHDQYEIVQQTQDCGSRGWWWLQQDAEMGVWWCPTQTSHFACSDGPLVTISFMATYTKVTPLQRGGPGSAWGFPLPFSELYGLLLIGKFQACKAFSQISRINRKANGWMMSLCFLASPGSLGVQEGWYISMISYTCLALEIFRVRPNDDTPYYGQYWESISSFSFAIMLEMGGQSILLHGEFLPYQRRWNFRQSDWAFGKLIWSPWDLMQFLQNGIDCTERYSQGQLQAFYTDQPVFVLALQVLVCLHHLCKEISLLREPG